MDEVAGSFRRYQLVTEGGARLVLVEEGLFHADDLVDRDPAVSACSTRFTSETTGLRVIPAARLIHEVLCPEVLRATRPAHPRRVQLPTPRTSRAPSLHHEHRARSAKSKYQLDV